MRRNKVLVRIAAAVVAILAVVVMVSSQVKYYQSVKDAQYIYPGIRISGVDVGSLTVEQAVEKVGAQAGDIVQSPVTISWQQHAFELSQQTLRGLAIREMAARAFTYGRMGGGFERWLSIILLPAARHDLAPAIGGQWPGLSDYLLEGAAEFEIAPQNAEIIGVDMGAQPGNRLRIKADRAGHELDIPKTARNVAAAVCAGLSTAEAVMYEQEAAVTSELIRELDSHPVTASFAFEGQQAATYAGGMLSGGRYIVMQPGQLLSVRDFIKYNSALSTDTNYNLAALHIASLIFRCSVQAGLGIPDHSGTASMPQIMYAPGTEAVVNEAKDLVIENMLNTPVVLSISGGWQHNIYRITCTIFRTPMYYSVMLKSFCDAADEGPYAQVFRVWVDPDGTEAGRELISEIRYR